MHPSESNNDINFHSSESSDNATSHSFKSNYNTIFIRQNRMMILILIHQNHARTPIENQTRLQINPHKITTHFLPLQTVDTAIHHTSAVKSNSFLPYNGGIRLCCNPQHSKAVFTFSFSADFQPTVRSLLRKETKATLPYHRFTNLSYNRKPLKSRFF